MVSPETDKLGWWISFQSQNIRGVTCILNKQLLFLIRSDGDINNTLLCNYWDMRLVEDGPEEKIDLYLTHLLHFELSFLWDSLPGRWIVVMGCEISTNHCRTLLCISGFPFDIWAIFPSFTLHTYRILGTIFSAHNTLVKW